MSMLENMKILDIDFINVLYILTFSFNSDSLEVSLIKRKRRKVTTIRHFDNVILVPSSLYFKIENLIKPIRE